jgi:hypothetical protein
MKQHTVRLGTTIAAVATLILGPAVALTSTPEPATAAPGVPNAPTVVYSENFENGPDAGNPQLLTAYTSASPQYPGGTYTAAPFWASAFNCNGFILSSTNTYPAGACDGNSASFTAVRGLAPILGTIGGTPTATNSVVAAYTAGANAASSLIQFATVSDIPLTSESRFLTFSVDAAGRNCQLAASTHPQLQFYVVDNGVEVPLGGVIDPCNLADPRTVNFGSNTRGGHYPASGSFLANSDSIGIVMRNVNGGVGGNDGAFDNIQILDATPELDKSFSTPNPVTGVSTLTLTLTNTTDLATKLGWSATDALESGLVVADPASASTTCTNGTIAAAAGSSTIEFAGDLAGDLAHRTSCTFSVDVVPAAPTAQGAPGQTFQNCGENLSDVVGIDLASCATVTFPPVAQLSVTKASTATTETVEGDVIEYSVTATNTGGSDYTAEVPATVTDDLTGVLDDATYNADAAATQAGTLSYGAPQLSWSGALPAGASVTITYSMTATLAGDGSLANTACIPAGEASGDACATVTADVDIAPSIGLVKSVSPSDPADFGVNEEVIYTFVVTNTGNLVLESPTVAEVSFDGSGPAPVITCPATPSLAPGAQMVCTAPYTITQDDVDNHSLVDPLVNEAQASAVASNDEEVDSEVASAQLPALQEPALQLDKSVQDGLFTAAGQTVTYEFLVTNIGNVTLTGVDVAETAFGGTGEVSAIDCPVAASSLAPGVNVTCTATYTLTQADVDAGSVTNQAQASALPPIGATITSNDDDAVVTIAQSPSIALTKTAGPGGFTEAGEVVNYGFEVLNSGNVTLTGVAIDELTFSGTGELAEPVCAPSTIEPGQTSLCSIQYTLTQADVDAGIVENSATAVAGDPDDELVESAVSSALVEVNPVSSISLVKSASTKVVAGPNADITYTFTVTNTGQATLSDLAIDDVEFTGTGVLSDIECPVVVLAPNASTACTAQYRTTAADVTAGSVDNTALALATAPGGAIVESAPSSATVTVNALAAALASTGSSLQAAGLIWAGMLLVGGTAFGVARLVRRRSVA